MLSDLLEDAELVDVAWDSGRAHLRLSFACLRRDENGSCLADIPVDLDLIDCEAIAIGHDPASHHIKPSQYQLDRWVQAKDLEEWSFDPTTVLLALNSPQAEEDLRSASRLEWIAGTYSDFSMRNARVVIFLESWPALGLPTNTVILAFGAKEWSASSGGAPLDLATWEQQLANWWKGWDRHWQDNRAKSRRDEPTLEDSIIPLREGPPPDFGYHPAEEPVVRLLPSDVPEVLIRPVRTWFESIHNQDWVGAATAWQNLDLTREKQAHKHEENFKWQFGRWGYARQIDAWWIEGAVGQVSVRGVEHKMANSECPSSNFESVWTFRLRLREGCWVIREISQGWPAFGSAPVRATAEKPWLQDWSSGSITTERP